MTKVRNNLKDSKILIVGGAGFVGSNLCSLIIKNYDPKYILIIDNLLSSTADNIVRNKKIKFIYGSIISDEILFQIPEDIDYVFNLACYHGNQSSIKNPIEDHNNNLLPNLKLYNHIKNFPNLKAVIYSAAGCAVASKTYKKATPTFESDNVDLFQDSPYSISKLVGELYGNYFFKQFDLPFIKARFQNVYGPKEILGAGSWRGTSHTIWRNVIPTFIWKSINNESLKLFNGGEATRDFIYVEDISKGLVDIAQKGKPGESYNLASGFETSIKDLAILINKFTGNKRDLDLLPKRNWDNSGKRFGSTIKSKNELGFTASTSLEKGIQKTIKWTKDNYSDIQKHIEKHLSILSFFDDRNIK